MATRADLQRSACPGGLPRAASVAIACGVALAVAASPALAQTAPPSNGGAAAGADDALPEAKGTPPGAVKGGATPARVVPRISSLACRTTCQAATSASPGSTLLLRGTRFGKRIESVQFLGAPGDADDASTAPLTSRSKRNKGTVTVRVPLSARSGPIAIVNTDGTQSRPTRAPLTVAPPTSARAVTSGLSIQAGVQDFKVAVGALRPPTLSYIVRASQPTAVAVALVRVSDGVPVASWPVRAVAPNTLQTLAWDGRVNGALAPQGSYRWQVAAQDSSGAKAVSATRSTGRRAKASQATGDDTTFTFLHQLFPLRGPHTYGTFVNTFGGGRGHQGQDVMAACGTPLVAARGGKVRIAGFQGAAGNYVVIETADGAGHAYMHLRSRPRLKVGQTVSTGQAIGNVGETGRASGCHLHFEQWPGGYQKSEPENPKADLMAWDRTS